MPGSAAGGPATRCRVTGTAVIGLLPADGRLDVLCVGAHPDDIEIGCGGTLLRLAGRPATTVAGLVLTGTAERRKEAEAALPQFFPGATVRVLDLPDGRLPAHWDAVKDALEDVAPRELRPTLVLAPRADDAHQDHRLLGRAGEHRLARRADPALRDPQVGRGPPRRRTSTSGCPRTQARRKVELLHRVLPLAARPGLVGRRALLRR